MYGPETGDERPKFDHMTAQITNAPLVQFDGPRESKFHDGYALSSTNSYPVLRVQSIQRLTWDGVSTIVFATPSRCPYQMHDGNEGTSLTGPYHCPPNAARRPSLASVLPVSALLGVVRRPILVSRILTRRGGPSGPPFSFLKCPRWVKLGSRRRQIERPILEEEQT